ncbi:hypothetical protein ACOSQ2_017752 [Xanthoceras sorbifolium]
MQPNVHGFSGQFPGLFSGFSSYQPHTNFNINPNHHILPPPASLPALNDYTLIDVPTGSADCERWWFGEKITT